jgi:hypothetical protein
VRWTSYRRALRVGAVASLVVLTSLLGLSACSESPSSSPSGDEEAVGDWGDPELTEISRRVAVVRGSIADVTKAAARCRASFAQPCGDNAADAGGELVRASYDLYSYVNGLPTPQPTAELMQIKELADQGGETLYDAGLDFADATFDFPDVGGDLNRANEILERVRENMAMGKRKLDKLDALLARCQREDCVMPPAPATQEEAETTIGLAFTPTVLERRFGARLASIIPSALRKKGLEPAGAASCRLRARRAGGETIWRCRGLLVGGGDYRCRYRLDRRGYGITNKLNCSIAES